MDWTASGSEGPGLEYQAALLSCVALGKLLNLSEPQVSALVKE